MPSTYTSLHYHIVYSTKLRQPLLKADWLPDIHQYLGGIVRNLGGQPECVGGVEDHVHMLIGLKPVHCLSDMIRDLKKAATNWIREQFAVPEFSWQEGYAAFTVSATAKTAVRRYIRNQREHHRAKSFRDELIDLLKRAGVQYDPQYLD